MSFVAHVQDDNVVLNGTPAGRTFLLFWTTDEEVGQVPHLASFCLLIYGIGFGLSTNAVAAARRPRIALQQPGGNALTIYPAAGTTLGSQTRRYEFSAGIALDTTLGGQFFREPLPEGLILLPGRTGLTEGSLLITIDNGQVGDSLDGCTIYGRLLPH